MLTYWRRNLPWMVFSLLVSFTMWVVVTRQENPEETNPISAVPVEVSGLAGDLVLRNPPPAVNLWVTAPRQRWARLGPTNFRASVDATGAKVGVQELPVKVASLDPTARVLSVEPARTSIGIERMASKEVRVQVRVMDSPPFGYRADAPIVAPDRVRVSGPESAVEQTVLVMASVRLESARSTVSEWVRPIPQGADGRELRGVVVSPESVLVEVPIEQELAYRSVPVVAQVTGEPALGYQIVGVTVEPSSITVVGDPAAVEQLRFLSTKPVDVGRTSKDLAVTTDPVLPTRVALTRDQPLVVRVAISAVPGHQTMRLSPTLIGVGSGLEGSVEPSTVQVVLSGQMPVLGVLTARDVQVIANVSGLAAGTHPVTPTVTLPSTVVLERMAPLQVSVVLRPAPATPTPSPTSTPSP